MSVAEDATGEVRQDNTPEWQPLMNLAGGEVTSEFMWMFEVRLADGRPIHAFKHIDTRQYVHLGLDGAAFIYVSPNRYRKVPAAPLLSLAVRRPITHGDVYRDVYAHEHRDRRRGDG